MSDAPTERDVEALCPGCLDLTSEHDEQGCHRFHIGGFDGQTNERCECRLGPVQIAYRHRLYAERIAQARREGAAEVKRVLIHTDPVSIGWTSQASKAAFLDGETAMANRVRAALRGDA